MALEGQPKDLSVRREVHGRILLGPSAFQSATGERRAFDLTGNPCATGGTHVIQIVDGEVDRVIATRAEGVAALGPRPTRRGELRACNQGGGINITMQAPRPVHTRTVDGQEQIVYRMSKVD